MVIERMAAIASVIRSAKRSRSTASAAPAGTRLASAARMTSEPSRRISSFSRPTALSSLSPRKELLQTSSASRSVLCTAVGRDRPHLVERDRHAARGGLPGRFGAGQPAADDVIIVDVHVGVARFTQRGLGQFLGLAT